MSEIKFASCSPDDEYARVMGHQPRNLYLDGLPAAQWNYGLRGKEIPGVSWKQRFAAFTHGAKAPRKAQAQLTPLDRLSKATQARKRANREFKSACLAAREKHTLKEMADATGLTRQRISQIVTA
jgi:hypothetical protein